MNYGLSKMSSALPLQYYESVQHVATIEAPLLYGAYMYLLLWLLNSELNVVVCSMASSNHVSATPFPTISLSMFAEILSFSYSYNLELPSQNNSLMQFLGPSV